MFQTYQEKEAPAGAPFLWGKTTKPHIAIIQQKTSLMDVFVLPHFCNQSLLGVTSPDRVSLSVILLSGWLRCLSTFFVIVFYYVVVNQHIGHILFGNGFYNLTDNFFGFLFFIFFFSGIFIRFRHKVFFL